MWPRFGIKIGNSTLCTAYVRSENDDIEILINKSGERTTPACLFWNDSNNVIEYGLTAKQKMCTRPYQAIANSFQFLRAEEMPLSEIHAALRRIPCEYNIFKQKFKLCYLESNSNTNLGMHAYELSVYEVQLNFFKNELELIRQYHYDMRRKPIVVLSIPSFYKENARRMLCEVAEDAGFHVAEIIDEPIAAALAYGLPETMSNDKFLLSIKCGGLYTHFALYKVFNGQLILHNEFGPFYIGGRNFTEVLVHYIFVEFLRKHNLEPNECFLAMDRIRAAASNAKNLLTTMTSTQIYIDALTDELDININLTRTNLESFMRPVIQNFMHNLTEFLNNAVDISNLASIVLLGATMKIPILRESIAAQYPHAQIYDSLPTDEVVAIGCARKANLLEFPQEMPKSEDLDEFKYTNEDIVIWHGIDETQAKVLLPKGTILPYHVELELSMCHAVNNKELFQLRAGHYIEQVFIEDAQLNNNLMYCIDADVEYQSEDEELVPLIRLRCVSQKQLEVIYFNTR